MKLLVILACFIVTGLMAGHAFGQNTGGVFGPVVNEDHRSFQYRAQYDPDADRFANRLHYQQAISGENMWRVIAQTRHGTGTNSGIDYLQAEWFWQLTPDANRWQQGLRFDYRYRDDGRSDVVGLNWMHEYRISDQWQARAILLAALEVGSGASDGVFVSTRGQLARNFGDRNQAGLEFYSVHGSTDSFPDYTDQFHQLGAYFSTPIAGGFNFIGRALFGMNNETPDFEVGFWLTKGF